MRAVILAGAAAILLLTPPGAALGEEETGSGEFDTEAFEERAREGLATLMMALESFIDAIPQYELPEVLDNGDIIIRRVHPDEDEPDSAPERQAEPEGESIPL